MEQESLAPLIEFIGKKFDQVDQRFEGMDRRLDQMATKEKVRAQQTETRRHFDVAAEGLRSQIQLVAEDVAEVSQRLDRRAIEIIAKVDQESAETRAMIRVSYAQLDERIQSLEHNYVALNDRVAASNRASHSQAQSSFEMIPHSTFRPSHSKCFPIPHSTFRIPH